MLEADITKRITRYLRSLEGWYGWKIHGGPSQAIGIPDVVGCYRGFFVGLEVKRPEKRHTLTKIQAATLRKIREVGGESHLVTSVAEVKKIIAELDERLDEQLEDYS